MIKSKNPQKHYNEDYFNWQKDFGTFGAWAELSKFQKYITAGMNVIDFGCGGGFLLNNINCKGKIGIEINIAALEVIEQFGIQAYRYVQDAPDNWADLIISNHALEHVSDPFNQICLLRNKLKTDGKIIFVVPCDSYSYKPNDINNHLYCWSPMTLGNLFTEAGYKVIESRKLIHKWPPFYDKIAKAGGRRIFDMISTIYGFVTLPFSYQVKIIAEKA